MISTIKKTLKNIRLRKLLTFSSLFILIILGIFAVAVSSFKASTAKADGYETHNQTNAPAITTLVPNKATPLPTISVVSQAPTT
jgi:hypothetical protein